MKKLSEIEKGSYSSEELYSLLKCSSFNEFGEFALEALSKKEIDYFVLIKLPFSMFNTNVSYQYKELSEIPKKLKSPFDDKEIDIYPEFVHVKYKIL